METTIRVSDSVKKMLDKMRLYERESYNDIIEVLLEDHKEVNEKTKKEIEEARKNIKAGKFVTNEEVIKKLGL